MNIYAIRDRLIDYFLLPFVGPDDKNVLASVARTINTGELTSDIAQAPHHFEVWRLGQVEEDGTLVPKREFLADCSSLVRTGIRQGGEGPQRSHRNNESTARQSGEHTAGAPGTAGAQERAPPGATPAAPKPIADPHQPPAGVPAGA